MSPALEAPVLSREARAAALTLEVMSALAAVADRDRYRKSAVVIPFALCRKAQMALELLEDRNGTLEHVGRSADDDRD